MPSVHTHPPRSDGPSVADELGPKLQRRRLRVSVTPYGAPFGTPVSVQVSAVDAHAGASVPGEVYVDGELVGHTDEPVVLTFERRNRRIRVPVDRAFGLRVVRYLDYPDGLVRASGYPDAAFAFGPPRTRSGPQPAHARATCGRR